MSGIGRSIASLSVRIPRYLLWIIWWLLALFALVGLCLPGGYDGDRLIGHLIRHWPLAVLLVIVGLLLTGHFGAGLGLPTLFRDDPDKSQWIWKSRSFGGGFGVALLASVVWIVIFFCNFIEFQERIAGLRRHSPRHSPPASEIRDWESYDKYDVEEMRLFLEGLAGPLGELEKLGKETVSGRDSGLGKRLAFLDGDVKVAKRDLSAWGLPADNSEVPGSRARSPLDEIAIHLERIREDARDVEEALAGLEAGERREQGIKAARGIREETSNRINGIHSYRAGWFLCGTIGLLVFFAGCFGVTTPELAKRRRNSGRRLAACREFLHFIGGIVAYFLLMMISAFLLAMLYFLVFVSIPSTGDLLMGVVAYTRLQDGMDASAVLVFIAGSILVFSVLLGRVTVGAGLVICMLFSLLAVLYLSLVALRPTSRPVVVGGVVVGLILLNSRPYKYRFPGMEGYYKKPLKIHDEDDEIERVGARQRPGPLDESGRPELLDDLKVLKAWAARLRDAEGGRKPKLVLVTATGAAYRASFWTTTVLQRLASEPGLAGFLNHVRLITGASGGMVGAAYVVAMLRPPEAEHGHSAAVDATEQLRADSRGDSLSAVVRRLIDGDLPHALWPLAQSKDRGRTLENQWRRLDRVTFRDLREGEKAGWRPSLILSPMIVETGRRLLFSNLDLYGLTDVQARNRKTVSIEEEDLDPPPAQGGHRRLSRSAVEFFRAFPEIYRTFQVKVAVRMNASFPYISPAVSLPVDPPRRVVDAGYYDNFGVNLAAAWAFTNREWIREHTSGLALVQIRAYESEAARKRLWVQDALNPSDPSKLTGPISVGKRLRRWFSRRLNLGAFARRLDIGVHALTTPLHGVVGARQWSMSYRNDEQVSLLGETFNIHYESGEGDDWSCQDRVHRRGKNGWFDTFVFENPLSFGMNWLITRGEIDEMKNCFDPNQGLQDQDSRILSRNNLDQLERLKAWWQDDRGSTQGVAATEIHGEANGRVL